MSGDPKNPKIKVLVVDDEEGMRMAISRALRNYSTKLSFMPETIEIDLLTAEDGKDALRKIEEFEPDVMFLDHKNQV